MKVSEQIKAYGLEVVRWAIYREITEEKKKLSAEEYVKFLEDKLYDLLEVMLKVLERKPEMVAGHEQAEKDLIKIANRLMKFRGKKIKKSRLKIYEDIEKKYDELKEEGASPTYAIAVNIISKKYKKSAKTLYQAFMKYQDRKNAKSK